ncbi:Uncharacterized protein TCM_037652 [Theobroma cacao]|uniref:Uncharacterized protein n=1 Tax=Theobroma cacao TaxID=3641 RepID=A0A061GTH5_THECC|nr:Uncharacterized protein TCM_037652 [Theobroma cacao]
MEHLRPAAHGMLRTMYSCFHLEPTFYVDWLGQHIRTHSSQEDPYTQNCCRPYHNRQPPIPIPTIAGDDLSPSCPRR